MSLYGHDKLIEMGIDEEATIKELTEMFFIDDIKRMSSEQIHEFCESEMATALVEKAVLKKPTLMRLSKADDEKRRIRLACYQLARDNNDPAWVKMKKYRDMWKEERAKIFQKYAARATRIARISQKNYIKTAQKQQATPEEKKIEAAK